MYLDATMSKIEPASFLQRRYSCLYTRDVAKKVSKHGYLRQYAVDSRSRKQAKAWQDGYLVSYSLFETRLGHLLTPLAGLPSPEREDGTAFRQVYHSGRMLLSSTWLEYHASYTKDLQNTL